MRIFIGVLGTQFQSNFNPNDFANGRPPIPLVFSQIRQAENSKTNHIPSEKYHHQWAQLICCEQCVQPSKAIGFKSQ